MPASSQGHSPLFPNQFQRCKPHSLPFRIIFDEYLARRKPDLCEAIDKYLPSGAADPIDRLNAQLAESERAYEALERAKERQEDYAGAEAACRNADLHLKQILHRLNGSALCLSGGGIRSASYGLGVLEGLARFSRRGGPGTPRPLMDSLDYLSTVSGGGYIGSWLMAWVERLHEAKNARPFGTAVDALAGLAELPSGDPEPRPVRHLRSYTSFLAPELGLTLDTFTLAAIVLRNLVVTWLMLVPIFAAALALPLVSWKVVPWVENWNFAPLTTSLAAMAAACFVAVAALAAWYLPSHHSARQERDAAAARRAPLFFVALVMAGSWLLAESWLIEEERGAWDYSLSWWTLGILFALALICFGALALSFWISYRRRLKDSGTREKHSGRRKAGELIAVMASTVAVSAAAVGLLDLLAVRLLPQLTLQRGWCGDQVMLIAALPSICLVLALGSSMLSGLLSDYEQEDDREWWARAGGLIISLVLAWIGVHAAVFYARTLWAAVVGLVLGGLASLIGWSPAAAAGTRTVKIEQLGGIGKFLTRHNLVLPAACAAALAFLFLGLETAEQSLLPLLPWPQTGLPRAAVLLLASIAAALLLNWAINVNTFSLHGMYRMRLMRAFLGASNPGRRPEPFTQFDPDDSRREEQMLHRAGAPVHIINTTLNLVGTHHLAWRQRKAEPFSMSPLHCGSWRRGYASTSIYGGDKGVSLATAMAISGAAFNPNMGYISSPLVALLMTVFNARLGWWLPNPATAECNPEGELTAKGRAFLGQNSPSFGLSPLLREAFGRTNDTYRWIDLTDGGHFENLGLYEMVLRRVRAIIVVDASADPECHFDDLGNALRKIEIDLGIPIQFDGGLRMQKGTQSTNLYGAVATIDYACADSYPERRWKAEPGTLIYIKSGLNGSEPPDIKAYADAQPTFPHESTGNQFFNESQFESYRHLGSHAASQIGKQTRAHAPAGTMESFVSAARAYTHKAEGS